jgi:hypothetical protein
MFYVDQLLEIDPDKKDGQWANNLITHFRSYWAPLVDKKRAEHNMALILSRYDMKNIEKMFKDPSKLGMKFIPIAVMEKVRNILIGERVKADIKVNLNAVDPTAESDREHDKTLLMNRADGEQLFSALQTSFGMPEFRLANEKKTKGKSPFRGNAEAFDELGLNPNSDFHVSYFFKVWHRLIAEMRAQDVVNFYFEHNRVRRNVDKWVNDILGKKCISAQAFVNEITGAIELKYIAPERVMIIAGKEDDGKDATCLGYEDTVTVGSVIKRIGNEFDWERDMQYLLQAANYSNKQEYTGIWDGETVYYEESVEGTTKSRSYVKFDQFLNFKVDIGYIEWKSWNRNAYKMGVDFHGNLRQYKKDASWELNKEEQQQGYADESWYTETTYKSYFLSTSSTSQKLFKYGPLYHQVVEGHEDEYSNFSIFFKKETGPTVAEVAEPWFEMIQECFTKGRWMVRRAKPKGRQYNYESIVQVANKMFADSGGTTQTKIQQVINMFEEGINEIFTIPKIGDQPVGGGVNPNNDLPNGVDPSLLTFREVIDWAVNNIKSDLGINDIREAYSPNPNDGLKLHQMTLEQSRNATDYIERMIDDVLRNMAIHTLSLTQDIIEYKSSLPYKFLERAVGSMAIRDLQDLEGIALHRYGIFVNSFATYMDRQKVMQETEIAWQKGEISYEVKMLVNAVDDYRKASYILAFEKERAKKEEQAAADRLHQQQMQLEALKQQNTMSAIKLKGEMEIQSENMRGLWYYRAAMAQANSRLGIKAMQIEAEPGLVATKTDAKIEEHAAKRSIDAQQPLPG